MRALTLLLLLLAGLAVGCQSGPGTGPTEDATRATVLRSLRGHLATVADAQTAADEQLNAALDPIRRLDEAVVALERAGTVDDLLANHADLHDEVTATTVDEQLRDPWFEVAEAIDEARGELARARELLDGDWEADYLDAQDAVLVAVREYARVADRVAQLVVRHWPTYEQLDARIAQVAEQRGNYRDAEEARDALLVELDHLLGPLATAQEELGEYGDRRRAAGQAVNEATADAVTVFEQRPAAAGPRS